MDDSKVEVTSPAKINLTLEIVGKRPDGFHDLCTIFQVVGLADTLSFDWNAPKLELICSQPEVPCNEKNLILKAIRAVESQLGFPIKARIRLEKIIPMQAGLGGGSSNAAAVLSVLKERFSIPDGKMFSIAKRLGSDVPFFLNGGTALGTGKGETLERLFPFPSFPVVIIMPAFSISTPYAYSKVTQYSSGEKTRKMAEALRETDLKKIFENFVNDFETVLFPVYPALRKIKETFLEHGALAAQLSGSGSAVFAIAANDKKANELASVVEPFGKAWVTST